MQAIQSAGNVNSLISTTHSEQLCIIIPDVQLEDLIFQGSCLGDSSIDDSNSHDSLYDLHRRASPDKTAAICGLHLCQGSALCLHTVPD